jgi:glycosyltransferase involved in cell wall biosynthesis
MVTTQTLAAQPQISVIVPARNEEASLADCLQSLVSQTGVPFEIIVVDDHSTDRTREIAESFAGVRIIEAGPLPQGWTGKNNAVTAGAKAAHGAWLLFTDADTVHLPGSLAAALKEAQDNGAELLSYSPEQIAVTFWEMATLPVVFAELARQYSPSKVSNPSSPIAAANGQYILIRHATYDAVGGHAAIAEDILEDVALARAVKSSGRKIRFRYAGSAVRTRMYRNYLHLRDGWTKNLALLFPNPGWLAVKTMLWWGLGWGILFGPLFMLLGAVLTDRVASLGRLNNMFWGLAAVVKHWWWAGTLIPTFGRNLARLRRANFDLAMEWLGALFGMPMFAYLLLRSKRAHANGTVTWKGRAYDPKDRPVNDFIRTTPTTAGRLS